MNIESITFAQLIEAIAVVLILCGAYNTVMTALKTRRDEKKRQDSPLHELEDRVDLAEEHLKSDKRRIEMLEKDTEDRKEETQLMMEMLLALVRHAIDGNNIEGLKELREKVNKHLIDKI